MATVAATLNIFSSASSVIKNVIQGLKKSSDATESLKKITEASEAVYKNTATAAQGLLKESKEAANNRIIAEQRLVSIMGNTSGMTQDGIYLVRDYALELEKLTSFGANIGMPGLAQLSTYVQDPQNIKKLGKSLYNLTAQIHGVNASSEQMMAVADILGQVMSGQTEVLIKNGFEVSEQQEKLLKYGSEVERTAALIEIIEGKIGGLAEEMGNIHEGNILKLANAWEDVKTKIGTAVLPHIDKVVTLLNEAFQSGKFEPFINLLISGFHLLGRIASWALAFIIEHIDIIMMSLIVLGTVVAIIGTIWLISWLAAIWPVLAVVGIVLLLMTILNKLGVGVSQVVGFIAGVFNTLVAYLINRFYLFWNNIVSFAEAIVNFFIDPMYAFEKLIYDLGSNIMGFLSSIINFAIDGLNKLIEKINLIPGIEIPFIPDFSTDWMDDFKPETDKNVVDFSKHKKQYKDLSEAFSKGYDFGNNLTSAMDLDLSSFLDIFENTGDDWSIQDPSDSLGDIGKVGEVGKIRDTVDISSEDIKMLRELAEMKNIQNFVSLTPSVSVQTGDITSGHDLDTIVNRITTTLETQIASGAKGVWNV